MNDQNKKTIDDIVASYASIGRLQKRRKLGLTMAGIVALPLIALTVLQIANNAAVPDNSRAQIDAPAAASPAVAGDVTATQSAELEAFKDQIIAEIAALKAEQSNIQAGSSQLENQSAELNDQLSEISDQRETLELENSRVTEQRERIAAAFAEIEAKQREIEARRAELAQEDPKLEEQRAALDAERNRLESLRDQVSEESSLLEQEIKAINAERTKLAAQRIVVQQRREELQRLIEKSRSIETDDTDSLDAERNAANPDSQMREQEDLVNEQPRNTSAPDRPYSGFRMSAQAEPASVVLSPDENLPYVDAWELDNMRGGFDLGDGMEVSIGLTRTAQLNGEEQYSSYVNLTDAMAGVPVSQANTASGNVVQSGNGNFVSPEVLDSISGSFSTIIQNSLDNQQIELKNVYDISIQNAASVVFDQSARKAVSDAIQLSN